MANIVKVSTADEGAVYFEVDEVAASGPQQVARGGHVMAELDERLTDALASVQPAARSIIEALSELEPEELSVEFGLKLDATLGAVVAKTGVSGHFTVKLTVRRPHSSAMSDAGEPTSPA